MNNLVHVLADISLSSAVLSLFVCFLLSYIYTEKIGSTEFFLVVTLMSSTMAALTIYIALSSFLWDRIPEKLVLLYNISHTLSAISYIKAVETRFELNDSILKACRILFSLIFLVLIFSFVSEISTGYNPTLFDKQLASHSIFLTNLYIDSSPTQFGELLALIYLVTACVALLRIIIINYASDHQNLLMTFGILVSIVVIVNNTMTTFPEYRYCLPLGFASYLFESIRMSVAIKKNSFLDNKRMHNDISHLSRVSVVGLATRQTLHELKNSLFTAKMAAAKIEQDHSSAVTQALERSVHKMENIIEDILLSTIRGETTQRKSENIKLIIEKAIESVVMKIEKNDIDLVFSSKIENTNVKVHKHRIILSIANLILNATEAIEVSDANKDHFIRISLQEKESCFEIKITDSGCGISKKDMKNIFKSEVTIGKKNSTGLGLSFAKSQIEDCAGSIVLDSETTNTTFIIKLPIDYGN